MPPNALDGLQNKTIGFPPITGESGGLPHLRSNRRRWIRFDPIAVEIQALSLRPGEPDDDFNLGVVSCHHSRFPRPVPRGDHFRDVLLRGKTERHSSRALVMLVAQDINQAASFCPKSGPRAGGDGNLVELDKFDLFLACFHVEF